MPTRLQDLPTNETCHRCIFKSLHSTVQKVELSQELNVRRLTALVVAVVWYGQVVQYHSNKPINCSQSSCYEADIRP